MDITGIGSLADLATTIIDKVWPDPAKAAEAKLALFQAQQAGQLAELSAGWENAKAQLAVDQVEAGNENLFVAGWRPFVGWGCGVAFVYAAFFQPMIVFIAALVGHPITPPTIDTSLMMQVLGGMLGFGAMRSWDKMQGVSPTKNG